MKKIMMILLAVILITGCDDIKVTVGDGEDKKEVNIETNKEKENDVKVVSYFKQNVTSDRDDIKQINGHYDYQPSYDNLSKVYAISNDGATTYYWHINLDIPKIDSTKTGATEINNKIKDSYADLIDTIKEGTVTPTIDGYNRSKGIHDINVSYLDHDVDDYKIINIYNHIVSYAASGGANNISYIYDVKNDKQLTNTEFIKKYNMTVNDIKEKYNGSIYELINGQMTEASDFSSNMIANLEQDFDNSAYIEVVDGKLYACVSHFSTYCVSL